MIVGMLVACGPSTQDPGPADTTGSGTEPKGASSPSDAETTTTTDTSSSSAEATDPTGSTIAGESSTGDGTPHECYSYRDCPPGQACLKEAYYGERCVDAECIHDRDCPSGVCNPGSHHFDGGECAPLPSDASTSSSEGSSDVGSSDEGSSNEGSSGSSDGAVTSSSG
jgi:hypothetical protein